MKNQNRDKIIASMCMTWRHDFGIIKNNQANTIADIISSGMTQIERERLIEKMAQIFDNDIAPNMTFKQDIDNFDLNSLFNKDE
jgi:hypothetical protein